jgi:dTDP-3-amino-2,3,6-trideoxy-4-keto-D-glucose/dTDP-3-amino-3,4,6-trideoxy-alpha-D-glucose/dTDP-2,6-dideoxy-D-kanosamine transaminase
MKVPFSFLTEQFANPEPIFQRIRDFLKRCDFTLGEDLQEFEKKYANYCGVKHAIGVGTGTDALFLSLKAAGVQPGDEVISAPNSFIATTGAIVQAGAKPVYVDCGEDLNIDVSRIEAAITQKTKAILPVHWAGAPADMLEINRIAQRNGLVVVEDACQALGAEIGGKRVGNFGIAAGFSTHPLKPLHVWGDGGVIVTNDDEFASQIQLLRNHGMETRDVIRVYGYNSRFDNLHAIVGNYVFETLDDTINKRIAHSKHFDRAFSQGPLSEVIQTPKRIANAKHVVHLYQVRAEKRDGLLKYLNSNGIEAKVHYPIPLHLQPAAQKWGYKQGMFPKTEKQSEEFITLPCHQYLSAEQIEYTVSKIEQFYEGAQ